MFLCPFPIPFPMLISDVHWVDNLPSAPGLEDPEILQLLGTQILEGFLAQGFRYSRDEFLDFRLYLLVYTILMILCFP
jgi:hypothetical protein